jgi:hypothetical protein
MERHQAALRKRATTVTADPPQPATITERATHAAPFDRSNLARAAAKTAFNYLIYRRPDIAHGATFDAVRRFILDGDGEWPFGMPTVLAESDPLSPLNSADLVPAHAVRVGSDGGGRLRCELELFGRLPFIVFFPGCWPREESAVMVHQFDAVARTHRQLA